MADAGPQFKQHVPKRRARRRADNRVGVFRALLGLLYFWLYSVARIGPTIFVFT